MLYHIMLLK